jgi:hypothetical protein
MGGPDGFRLSAFGFHGWQRHEDLVVMSAELEMAAWDLRGVKRWSTFVEPPWN